MPEEISPAGRRADVRVAEPELVVEELAIGALALEPELRRHHGGIAQDADHSRIVDHDLALESERLVPRALLELRARDDGPVGHHEDHVLVMDARDRLGVVALDSRLVLDVERGNRAPVFVHLTCRHACTRYDARTQAAGERSPARRLRHLILPKMKATLRPCGWTR